HEITDALLPQAASVFDAATALDTAMDMVDPQPTLVELLVRHVLLPRELLPQIEINSFVDSRVVDSWLPIEVCRDGQALPLHARIQNPHDEVKDTMVAQLALRATL